MSSRLVDADRRRWSRWPSASGDDSPFRADEPYRRALRGHARPPARRRPRALLGAAPGADRPHADLAAVRRARRAARRPRRRRRVAARPRRRRAGRRRAGPVAPRGRGVRLPPLRARPAPELRRARGGRRRAARRWPGVAADYLALDEDDRVGAARRRAATRPAAAQPGAALRRARPATSWRSSTRRPTAVDRLGPGAVPHYVISKCESVSDVLEVAVLLKEVGLVHAGRDAALRRRHRAAVRDDRRPAPAPATTLAALLALPRLPALVAARGGRAGGDARLLRLEQGRRLPHRQLGAVPGPGRPGRRRPGRRASGCACSTAGAAPSAAAAGRATRRSSPSRRAASTGRCASPSRARSSPPSTPTPSWPAATSRRWWPPRCEASRARRRRPRRRTTEPPTRLMDELADAARHAYRDLVYDDRRVRRVLPRRSPRSPRSPSSTSAAARRRAPPSDRIEDLRAIPWVFWWIQCRLMLPGWYGAGTAFDDWIGGDDARGPRAAADCTSGGRSSARSLEHGHGAGQVRPRHRPPLRRAGARPRRCATGSSSASPAEHARTVALVLADHRAPTLLADNPPLARSIRNRFPYLDPLHHLQVELLRRRRAGDDDELVARGIQLTHQRHGHRPAQQRLRARGGLRVPGVSPQEAAGGEQPQHRRGSPRAPARTAMAPGGPSRRRARRRRRLPTRSGGAGRRRRAARRRRAPLRDDQRRRGRAATAPASSHAVSRGCAVVGVHDQADHRRAGGGDRERDRQVAEHPGAERPRRRCGGSRRPTTSK